MHKFLENLQRLSSEVSRETWEKLITYSQWVMEWNQRINLSGAKTVEEFFEDQVLDCLAAGISIPRQEIWIDIGSGSGLPGIVWALLFPQSKFYLVEAKEKKCSFLYRVVSGLKIENVKVINQRFENVKLSDFNSLTQQSIHCVSRGTAAPIDLMKMAQNSKTIWNDWFIFASQQTTQEFLSEARKFNFEMQIISYSKFFLQPCDKGLISQGILCRMTPASVASLETHTKK